MGWIGGVCVVVGKWLCDTELGVFGCFENSKDSVC